MSLIIAATAFAASAIAHKIAEAAVERAWGVVYSRLTVRPYTVVNTNKLRGTLEESEAEHDPDILASARLIYEHEPCLRRAELVMDPALDGARLLWVDDSPANNINEMHMLRSFGIEIVSAWSTSEASSELSEQRFDLVVSDMERDGDSSQGLRLLELMRGKGDSPELIFYVGEVDTTRGKLSGSFGIADRPDDLFHLFMDSLERNRV